MKLSVYKKSKIIWILFLGILQPQICLGIHNNLDSLQNKLLVTIKPEEKIKLLNLLSENYLKNDPVKAYNYAFQARSLAETLGDLMEKSKALYLMAMSYYKQGQYFLALNLMKESQDGFKKLNNKSWYGRSTLELGKIFERQYEFDKAIESLLMALEIFKELNDSVKLAETNNIIGISYSDQKEYDKAFGYFYESMSIRMKLRDKTGLSAVYNNIGEIYLQKENLLKAMEYFKQAVKINLSEGRHQSLSINYDNVGKCYMLLGNYDSAAYYMSESLKIAKSIKDNEWITAGYISKGKLFKQKKKYEEAAQYFDSGFQIAQSNGLLLYLQDAAYELSEVYKQSDQFQQAYLYHKIFKKVEDSLFDVNNIGRITQLEMKLVFDHENKMKRLEQERKMYNYFLFAVVLVSLLLIAILIYGRLVIKIKHAKTERENLILESQQLKTEIEYKNRELATNVMYLLKKNELINFISEKLLKTLHVFKKERQQVIREIIIELQSNIDSDIWKTFEERFRAVHKEFYIKLKDRFPNLTENEIKLCALLRLNLSTKDIAAITHQNPNSIDVARTRLRKKLDLSNKEITLISFLENL